MGRLTEIIWCASVLAADIEQEQLSRLDLSDPATNEQIKELRRQNKRRRQAAKREPLFEGTEE